MALTWASDMVTTGPCHITNRLYIRVGGRMDHSLSKIWKVLHLRIGLVPVDCEAMARRGAVDRAPAEAVEREPPVVVEVLEHVTH